MPAHSARRVATHLLAHLVQCRSRGSQHRHEEKEKKAEEAGEEGRGSRRRRQERKAEASRKHGKEGRKQEKKALFKAPYTEKKKKKA